MVVVCCLLIMLKVFVYELIGGIVVVLIMLLFEKIGGNCNWDYCYCWLCDVMIMLFVLMCGGYYDEVWFWCMWFGCVMVGLLE